MIDKIEVGKCYLCDNTNRVYKIISQSNFTEMLNGNHFYNVIMIDLGNGFVEEKNSLWLDYIDEYYFNEMSEDDFAKILNAHSLYMSTVTALAERIRNTALQHEN